MHQGKLYENQKVVISSSVTNLGSSAFEDCTVLTEVSFADDSHLKTIPQRTFASCPRFKPVGLPIGLMIETFHRCMKTETEKGVKPS